MLDQTSHMYLTWIVKSLLLDYLGGISVRLKIFALVASLVFVGALVTSGIWVDASHGSTRPVVKEQDISGGACC
ncbi:hypothetical protein ACWDSD_14070 [Streptomyces spiralis]